MKTPRAGRSNSRQRRREASLQPEPRASSGGDPEIDPISGTADAVRRSQQKVQLASRKKISRDSECDEPRVVRGSSKVNKATVVTMSTRSVRKPNKREDTTFYDDVYDAPRQTNKHSTSWRSDVPPPCLGGASHGWVRYTRADFGQEAVGGSTTTMRTRS